LPEFKSNAIKAYKSAKHLFIDPNANGNSNFIDWIDAIIVEKERVFESEYSDYDFFIEEIVYTLKKIKKSP